MHQESIPKFASASKIKPKKTLRFLVESRMELRIYGMPIAATSGNLLWNDRTWLLLAMAWL